MILERAEITVTENTEDAFAAAMHEHGIGLLASATGCRSVKVGRGVENPGRFIMVLEWDSVEAHMTFTKTPDYASLLDLIDGFIGDIDMQHFDLG